MPNKSSFEHLEAESIKQAFEALQHLEQHTIEDLRSAVACIERFGSLHHLNQLKTLVREKNLGTILAEVKQL